MICLNVIQGSYLFRTECVHFPPAYCTGMPQFIIFALWKSLLAWKACSVSPGSTYCYWCRWQQWLLSHSAPLTDMKIVRICQEALQSSSRSRYKYFRWQHPQLFSSSQSYLRVWLTCFEDGCCFDRFGDDSDWFLSVCCVHVDTVITTRTVNAHTV